MFRAPPTSVSTLATFTVSLQAVSPLCSGGDIATETLSVVAPTWKQEVRQILDAGQEQERHRPDLIQGVSLGG